MVVYVLCIASLASSKNHFFGLVVVWIGGRGLFGQFSFLALWRLQCPKIDNQVANKKNSRNSAFWCQSIRFVFCFTEVHGIIGLAVVNCYALCTLMTRYVAPPSTIASCFHLSTCLEPQSAVDIVLAYHRSFCHCWCINCIHWCWSWILNFLTRLII
jgi:hypothetical protein